jgi:hypothetical protein
MNRTAQLFFVVIALMVSGCSKQAQVQPAATDSTPSGGHAAAPTPAPPSPVQAQEPASQDTTTNEGKNRVLAPSLTDDEFRALTGSPRAAFDSHGNPNPDYHPCSAAYPCPQTRPN